MDAPALPAPQAEIRPVSTPELFHLTTFVCSLPGRRWRLEWPIHAGFTLYPLHDKDPEPLDIETIYRMHVKTRGVRHLYPWIFFAFAGLRPNAIVARYHWHDPGPHHPRLDVWRVESSTKEAA